MASDPFSLLSDLAKSVTSYKVEDINVRKRLLEGARKLMLSLERPNDVIERVCFQLTETAAIRTAIDCGLFKEMAKSEEPKTMPELATAINVDPVLLGRLMRNLSAYGAVQEVGSDKYASTTVSKTFALKENEYALEFCFDFLSPGWLKIPAHLRRIGHTSPNDTTKTALTLASNEDGVTVIDLLMKSPHLPAFNSYMSSFTQGHQDFYDLYPITELIKDAKTDPESVFFVDVGGGTGHQAILLKNKYPEITGKFIVQDLAAMVGIPEMLANSGVEFQAHDFFQPQTVKGAKVYYLRFVMHDWSMERNVAILKNIKDAMDPTYSKVLVNEWIVPERGPSRFMTAQDFNMMSSASGMERTLALHTEELEKAGLKVTRVFEATDGVSESVIEAVVA